MNRYPAARDPNFRNAEAILEAVAQQVQNCLHETGSAYNELQDLHRRLSLYVGQMSTAANGSASGDLRQAQLNLQRAVELVESAGEAVAVAHHSGERYVQSLG
jgi:hypothetical protein